MERTQTADRPATPDDAQRIVDLINAEARRFTGEDRVTLADLRREWDDPNVSLDTDTRIVQSAGGTVLAFADYANHSTPHVQGYGFVSLAADPQATAAGARLVKWLVERAQADVPRAPAGARVTLITMGLIDNDRLLGIWRDAGFVETRRYFEMRMNLEEAPPVAPPHGYELRAMLAGDERAIFETLEGAFRDHHGYVEPTSVDEEFARWRRHFLESEDFDPALQSVAVDAGGTIVGASMCRPRHGSDETTGWVAMLGVAAGHRRHGLGEALLRRSFAVLRDHGRRAVGLGVDGESLTNATRLYEKCGMHRHRVYAQLSLVLRDGEELANTG
mgnify:CR=1 FL=1